MTQTQSQRRASDQVAAWLATHEKNPRWLSETTGADPGTISDFLSGARWPKVGTQGKIEKALGWPAGCIRQIGNGADPVELGALAGDDPLPRGARYLGDPEDGLVEFTVEGNFGVRAVVKGPIRDLDALQAAVSKLISGMQTDESNTRAVP